MLVVEDDDRVREVVVRMLESLGYRPLAAATTDEALDILRAQPVDVLLTDVVLAEKRTGHALAIEAEAIVPGLSILYMSGYTENAIVHNGEIDVDVTLLTKPFTPRTLALAVERVLKDR